MQTGCVMPLHNETVPRLFLELGRRLGRFLKPTLSFVIVKRHGGYCNSRQASVGAGSCGEGRPRQSKPSEARQLPVAMVTLDSLAEPLPGRTRSPSPILSGNGSGRG